MLETTQTVLPLDVPEAPAGQVSINDRLWFLECDGYINVFLREISLYRFSRDDDLMLRFVAVNLRLDGHATQRELAQAFGHSVRSQMRWEKWYRENDLPGLEDGERTGRPRGVAGGNRVFLAKWFEQGVSNREIARRLGVSETTVRRELSRLGLSRSSPVEDDLFEEEEEDDGADGGEEEDGADTNSVDEAPKPALTPPGTLDVDPLSRVFDRFLAQSGLLEDAVPFFAEAEKLPRAGVLLAVPLFVASGALAVFERIYGSLGAAFYGLRSTVVCLFLTALLRVKYAENLKEYSPPELGRIMGLDRMPEVKTLRRKLRQLAGAKKGEQLMRALAELRIEGDVGRVGYIYLDGHVREYHGKHPLGKAHITGKRISAPAATDTWVNDAEGDPLFVVTSELNAGLTKMLPKILTEVREMVGKDHRVTVIFDRGGYSPQLFVKLKDMGFDLITYRKGTKDPVAPEEFREVQVERGGKKETWKIHDKEEVPIGIKHQATKEKEAEPWLVMRQVSRLRKDGEGVTQVLTTRTQEDLAAEEVLVWMFSRWRQENFFKYMKAEFALDALTEYGVEELSAEADRPNPKRKKLEKKRKKVKAKLEKLLSQLGEEVEQNDESRRRTVRGLKIANAKLRREIAEVTKDLEDLTSQIEGLPARVKADQLRRLKRDRKLVVDAMKMVAYQVESDLHRMLFDRYKRADDEGRTLLHAIFQSSAKLEIEDKTLKVTITRLSSPHRTKALKELCDELNKVNAKFPGSNLRIVLAAESPEHAIA
jgi:transposase